MEEGEIAPYNAQNGTSYLARGYYVYDEAPASGLLTKNGKYYVFNDQIPMSWDELLEIAELFTKSYNASSPTNYGFFNEWWFSFGWGVGGDCLEWDEELGQYVMALDEEFCYDRERADVVGGVLPLDGCEAAFMTRLRNLVLSNADDHAAAILAGAPVKQAKKHFGSLRKWVRYLEKYGLKPANQLCTDDFAGHLADNVNLAIKALAGLEAFSVICGELGKEQLAAQYRQKAEQFAEKFKALVGDGVMPLAYGQEGTYSLKYNIRFDKLAGFNLIGQDVCERETAQYIRKNGRYGVPLDPRAAYTKVDWILWTATLTDDAEKARALYAPVLEYLANTSSRKPFGDRYDTQTGVIEHFFNRTVVGGVFAPLLKTKQVFRRR